MENDVLKELYRRYSKELYLYIFGICKNHAAAEDLLQETFVKALLSSSDDIQNMRAWLYRVAKNSCYNYMKKESRIVSEDRQKEAAADTDILEELLKDEQQQTLYRAIEELAPQKREVLTLQYFGGFSQKEIAAFMNLSPENVRVLAYRGKKELKEKLEGRI